MKNKTNPSNIGAVVSVRGSVVDIRFEAYLPPIYSLLHAKEGEIAIEVLAQLDAHRVRGIALTPTQGLARGIAVEDTGGPLKASVGKGILSRMFDVFGNAIDRQAAPSDVQWRTVHRAPPALARRSTKSEIFETGIKVIDVLVPLERGGKAGLFGGAGGVDHGFLLRSSGGRGRRHERYVSGRPGHRTSSILGLVQTFLSAHFKGAERLRRRLAKVAALEREEKS